VLITGTSGAGKSTISQTLQREYGWRILDDDSCAAELRQGEVFITPLGGIPRMRGNAAQSMNLSGEAIPGYHGNKISIPADGTGRRSHSTSPQKDLTVVGVVSLNPVKVHELTVDASISRIFGDEAFFAVAGAGVSLNRFAPSWKQKRFSVSARLCQGPVFAATYVPGNARPLDVARLIENCFSNARNVQLDSV
jgi:hypothetical protein